MLISAVLQSNLYLSLCTHIYMGASLVAQTIKNLPAMQEDPWRREWLLTPGFLA